MQIQKETSSAAAQFMHDGKIIQKVIFFLYSAVPAPCYWHAKIPATVQVYSKNMSRAQLTRKRKS